MADLKISQLTGATTPLAGTEVLPIVQSSSTKKVAVSDLTAGRTVSMSSLNVAPGASNTLLLGADETNSSTGTAAGIYNSATAGTSVFYEYHLGSGYTTSGQYIQSSRLVESTANLSWSAGHSAGGGIHRWYVNDTLRMSLDGSGNATLSTGNLIQGTAAKGINFTANTPAAGMTSQLLNWYEEGTWTPTITAYSGTITTVGSVAGSYTRVGRLVTLSGSFVITTNGTGSVLLQVSSLPFAGSGATVSAFSGSGQCTTTGKAQSVQYSPTAAKIYLADYDNTYSGADGRSFIFSVTYEV
jgi:hypothetical protein